MDEVQTGILWLTDPQRDFLAHLLTLTIQQQLKPERSYERIAEALEDIAADGLVSMRADDETCGCWYAASPSSMPPATGWNG